MRTITIHATRNATPPLVIPEEIRGKREFMLHDFQCDDDNFNAYYPRVCNADGTPRLVDGEPIGLPETEKAGENAYDILYEPFQWMWFELVVESAKVNGVLTIPFEVLKTQRWPDLLAGDKAFCNKRGVIRNPRTEKRYYDFINQTSNLTEEPAGKERVTTCGNQVIMWGGEKSIGGVPFQGVLCLEATKLPTSAEILAHPLYRYFIHTATTCRPEPAYAENFPRRAKAPHGTYVVNPFPHLGGLDVPVPFVSSGGEQVDLMGLHCCVNYIATRRLVLLDDNEMPSPYVRLKR